MSLNVLNLSISDDADTAIASGVSSIDVEGQKVTFNLRDGGSKSIEVPAVPGPYFTPEIGTVETLSAGSKATASIDTDPETMKATLNLGIPRGGDGSGGGGGGHELTEEHLTGDTFNGKPVYEKVIIGKAPSTQGEDVVSNISSLNIDDIISIDGMVYSSDKRYRIPHAHPYDTSTMVTLFVFWETKELKCCVRGTYYLNSDVRAILKYTKTTD